MKVWTDIFRLGAEIHHPSADVPLTVTREFVLALIANFARLTGEGHEIVVLREHERAGHVWGQVHSLRVQDGFVQGLLEFFNEADREAYNEGRLRRFSPGFALDFTHPHTGESMGPTLLEVSYTAMPFQTNLRPPQETNPGMRLALTFPGHIATLSKEESMSKETQKAVEPEAADVALAEGAEEEEKQEFNIEAAFTALSEQISTLVSLMVPAEEEEEEEDAALSDSERQVAELSRKVERLQDDKTRLELSARGIDADEALVKLARTDRALFDSVTTKLAAAVPTGQKPIGRTGDAEVSGAAPTVKTILAHAEKEGVKRGSGSWPRWVAANYPEQYAQLITG